jgi:electron transfer flavoprotein alpha subunit
MKIVVFAENQNGNFKKSTFEAVAYAAGIASSTNGSVTAVSIGKVSDDKLAELATFGADQIVSYSQERLNTFTGEAFSQVLNHAVEAAGAELVVISNTYSGKMVAPRLAAKLKAGIASGVVSFPNTSNGFVVRRSVFSGKAFADVNMSSSKKVVAITPNSFTIAENAKAVNIQSADANIDAAGIHTKTTEISIASGKIPLTEAELVVSGGRGMKGPENWHLIETLADTLGAATACSKPVSDIHWRPHSEHVGQTGITIKPNLYIAIGISGAIQHLAGVSSSKVIVAINKDPEAPFFKAADYGIVGDAFEVLPMIIEAAKTLKSAS